MNFKNFIFLFLMFIIFFTFPCSLAYADSLYENQNSEVLFEVKSGIDLEKDYITTFEKTLTITGVSQSGNNINISVFQKISSEDSEQQDTYIQVYSYSLLVGPSGYFSQAIDLVIGENLVVISAESDELTSSISAIIKRKNSEIKSALESIIILPISRD